METMKQQPTQPRQAGRRAPVGRELGVLKLHRQLLRLASRPEHLRLERRDAAVGSRHVGRGLLQWQSEARRKRGSRGQQIIVEKLV